MNGFKVLRIFNNGNYLVYDVKYLCNDNTYLPWKRAHYGNIIKETTGQARYNFNHLCPQCKISYSIKKQWKDDRAR